MEPDDDLAAQFGIVPPQPETGGATSIEQAQRMRALLSNLGANLEEGGTFDSYGNMENALFGAQGQDASLTNYLTRGMADLIGSGRRASENRGLRDQIAGIPFEEQSRALEGQGSVSNAERQMAKEAFTNINSNTTTTEQAKMEINRLLEFYDFANYRSANGITIDENGVETRDGKRGITTYDENGNKQFVELPESYTKHITVIPQWYDDRTVTNILNSLGPDEEVFFRGQPMTSSEAIAIQEQGTQ